MSPNPNTSLSSLNKESITNTFVKSKETGHSNGIQSIESRQQIRKSFHGIAEVVLLNLQISLSNWMSLGLTWPVRIQSIQKGKKKSILHSLFWNHGQSTVSHFLGKSAIWYSATDPTTYPTSSELLLTAQLSSSPSLSWCHCRYLAFGDYMLFP